MSARNGRGSRCGCGAPLVRVPGKRLRYTCENPACQTKQAKRSIKIGDVTIAAKPKPE